MNTKEFRGITLISLIITIIILMIMVGVTLNLVVGEEGIVGRAIGAKEQYEIAQDKEIINLAIATAQISANYNKYTVEDLEQALAGHDVKNVKQRGNNISLTLNGHDYRIKPDGEVIEYTYMEPTGICWKMDGNGTLRLKANDSSYTDGTDWDRASIKKVIIEEPIAPNNTSSWFYGCADLNEIQGINNLHTENITSMQNMFANCKNLKILDVSNFDTSSVKYMGNPGNWSGGGFFRNCSSITTLDVSCWDTSNVVAMGNMFEGCTELQNLDVSRWDTSKVQYMNSMFGNCKNITKFDFYNWDTGNVKGMEGMFEGCSRLIELNLNNFDTKNVTNMRAMFSFCTNLTKININSFDTKNVQHMGDMFSNTSISILDLSGFDTRNVTSMLQMFRNCRNLETIYVSNNFSREKLTDSRFMFNGSTNLIGGKGTKCNGGDATYARIDNPPDYPGYFTLKP